MVQSTPATPASAPGQPAKRALDWLAVGSDAGTVRLLTPALPRSQHDKPGQRRTSHSGAGPPRRSGLDMFSAFDPSSTQLPMPRMAAADAAMGRPHTGLAKAPTPRSMPRAQSARQYQSDGVDQASEFTRPMRDKLHQPATQMTAPADTSVPRWQAGARQHCVTAAPVVSVHSASVTTSSGVQHLQPRPVSRCTRPPTANPITHELIDPLPRAALPTPPAPCSQPALMQAHSNNRPPRPASSVQRRPNSGRPTTQAPQQYERPTQSPQVATHSQPQQHKSHHDQHTVNSESVQLESPHGPSTHTDGSDGSRIVPHSAQALSTPPHTAQSAASTWSSAAQAPNAAHRADTAHAAQTATDSSRAVGQAGVQPQTPHLSLHVGRAQQGSGQQREPSVRQQLDSLLSALPASPAQQTQTQTQTHSASRPDTSRHAVYTPLTQGASGQPHTSFSRPSSAAPSLHQPRHWDVPPLTPFTAPSHNTHTAHDDLDDTMSIDIVNCDIDILDSDTQPDVTTSWRPAGSNAWAASRPASRAAPATACGMNARPASSVSAVFRQLQNSWIARKEAMALQQQKQRPQPQQGCAATVTTGASKPQSLPPKPPRASLGSGHQPAGKLQSPTPAPGSATAKHGAGYITGSLAKGSDTGHTALLSTPEGYNSSRRVSRESCVSSVTRQAAPMVLCVDNIAQSTPEVLEMEMEKMTLDELKELHRDVVTARR